MRKFSYDFVKVRIFLAFCLSATYTWSYSQVNIPMPKLETTLNGKKELLQLSALNINVSITIWTTSFVVVIITAVMLRKFLELTTFITALIVGNSTDMWISMVNE